MINEKIKQFLIGASSDQIQKLTDNNKIAKCYNILFIFNTKPNSKERLHWLTCCDILCRMNELKENNSNLTIIFYYKNLNYPIWNQQHTLSGKKYIKKFLDKIWEYTNKDNIHIIPNQDSFGVKDWYKYFKWACEEENININNAYISKFILDDIDFKEKDNFNLTYRIIINNE